MLNKKNKISILAIRKANAKLVAQGSVIPYTENINHGEVSYRKTYYGKTYDINIPNDMINSAFKKSKSAVK